MWTPRSGFAVLAEQGRRQLPGLELADSVTLDPHKWLYQPFECGCLLVRNGRALRAAFVITPDYLRDAVAAEGEVNFGDLGLQLTRAARAFKVWISVHTFGLERFRAAIERSLELAAQARDRIEESDAFELAAPPSLGIVCFRRRFDGVADLRELELRHAGLAAALERSGRGLVSTTRLHGKPALRLCILNHTTAPEHIERVLDFLERADPDPIVDGVRRYQRHPAVRTGWLGRPAIDGSALRGLPLFRSLSAADAERVAALARTAEAAPGDLIVEQWSPSRDFYVIREGTVDVLLDGERIREMGPGEFFGELAALDWGAGYGYPRLASVVAVSRLEFLIFSSETLNGLVREFSGVEEEIRAALQERLARR